MSLWYNSEESQGAVSNAMDTLNDAHEMLEDVLNRVEDAADFGIVGVLKDLDSLIGIVEDMYWAYDERNNGDDGGEEDEESA